MDTIPFILANLGYWAFLLIVALFLPGKRKAFAVTLNIAYVAALIPLFAVLEPWQRLWLATAGLLFSIKAALLLRLPASELRAFNRAGVLIYMTAWPGMDPAPFKVRTKVSEDGHRFVRGYLNAWLGAALFVDTALAPLTGEVKNCLTLVALLLMVHFGYADILSCLLRLLGFAVTPLFDVPLMATSLQDFWSKRWNHAFVEMNKILFLPLARKHFDKKTAVFLIFVLSGVLHELGITYGTGKLLGLPTLYFVIQGIGMLIEKAAPEKFKGRFLTLAWILLPVPLLFNGAFLTTFMAPLTAAITNATAPITTTALLNLGLWLAGIGHFCTLMAGLQVPFRLNWKEELARLGNFNRKIMLNYAAYVGLIIVAFGWLTLKLHYQILAGETCAVHLCLIIAIFWILRLVVDAAFFKHDDWPKGAEFVIGHTLLNTLFVCLAFVYTWVVVINFNIIK